MAVAQIGSMRLFWSWMLVAVLVSFGCGEDSVVERHEREGPADVTPSVEEPGENPLGSSDDAPETPKPVEDPPGTKPTSSGRVLSAEPPASAPRDEPSSASSAGAGGPEPSEGPSPEPEVRLADTYVLARVDGKGLPAVTDTRPGCEIRVLSGRVTIDSSNRFRLATAIRETCDGRVTSEDTWEAAGTVRRTGSSLHFEGSVGEAFGTARGDLGQGTITIRSIAGEGGEERVDWEFVSSGQ